MLVLVRFAFAFTHLQFFQKEEKMKNENVKATSYIPAELEIIAFECNDIVTTSIPTDDENEDGNW